MISRLKSDNVAALPISPTSSQVDGQLDTDVEISQGSIVIHDTPVEKSNSSTISSRARETPATPARDPTASTSLDHASPASAHTDSSFLDKDISFESLVIPASPQWYSSSTSSRVVSSSSSIGTTDTSLTSVSTGPDIEQAEYPNKPSRKVSSTLAVIQDIEVESTPKLDPTANTFEPPNSFDRESLQLKEIVEDGKNDQGDLSKHARTELIALGLKSIPAMQGPLSLPYARCPSGIDAFLFSADKEEDPYTFILETEGRPPGRCDRNTQNAAFRIQKVPLPGNARYSQPSSLSNIRIASRAVSVPPAFDGQSLSTPEAADHGQPQSARASIPRQDYRHNTGHRWRSTCATERSKLAHEEPATTLGTDVVHLPRQDSTAFHSQAHSGGAILSNSIDTHAVPYPSGYSAAYYPLPPPPHSAGMPVPMALPGFAPQQPISHPGGLYPHWQHTTLLPPVNWPTGASLHASPENFPYYAAGGSSASADRYPSFYSSAPAYGDLNAQAQSIDPVAATIAHAEQVAIATAHELERLSQYPTFTSESVQGESHQAGYRYERASELAQIASASASDDTSAGFGKHNAQSTRLNVSSVVRPGLGNRRNSAAPGVPLVGNRKAGGFPAMVTSTRRSSIAPHTRLGKESFRDPSQVYVLDASLTGDSLASSTVSDGMALAQTGSKHQRSYSQLGKHHATDPTAANVFGYLPSASSASRAPSHVRPTRRSSLAVTADLVQAAANLASAPITGSGAQVPASDTPDTGSVGTAAPRGPLEKRKPWRGKGRGKGKTRAHFDAVASAST